MPQRGERPEWEAHPGGGPGQAKADRPERRLGGISSSPKRGIWGQRGILGLWGGHYPGGLQVARREWAGPFRTCPLPQ